MSEVSLEAQKCFVGDDGFRRCNYVFRNGKIIQSKSGKWLKFPVRLSSIVKKRKLSEEMLISTDSFEKKPL